VILAGIRIAFDHREGSENSMLSLKRYRWLCVLGTEVGYTLCLLGGFLPIRSAAGIELHHKLFETLPGFVWINGQSVILGGFYMFVFAWIFGTYFVWMHNTSLTSPQTRTSEEPRKAA
jgi:hypothetical protein